MKFKRKLTKEQKEKRERKRYYERVEAFEEGRLSEVGEISVIEQLFKNDEVKYLNDNVKRVINTFVEKGLVNV